MAHLLSGSSSKLAWLAFTSLAVTSCAPHRDGDDPVDERVAVASEALCNVTFDLEPRLSLLVTQPVREAADDPLTNKELRRLDDVWNTVKPRFSFKRVMKQILATGGAIAPANELDLFHRWMDTYNDDATARIADVRHCDDAGVDPRGFGLACPRAEGTLADAAFDPFTGTNVVIEPIAIVNRFDLAPTSGATCGEYRIIFAMTSGPFEISRLFYIFEGALANPTPDQGLAGCAPIADAWQKLSDPARTPAQIANLLEKLYFTGLDGFDPVVHADNYGAARGQIRTNQLDGFQWTLREFHTTRHCDGDCTLSIDQVTTKANPASELFASTHPLWADFMASYLKNVRSDALLGATDVAAIGLAVRDRFNTWESREGETDYANAADATTTQRVQARLDGQGMSLEPVDMFVRTRTQACMGCHRESAGADLGGDLTWPSDASCT